MKTDWRSKYADKVVSAAQAVQNIRRGNRVFIGSACGEPQALVRTMAEWGPNITDTEVVQILPLGVAPYADPKYAPYFRANAFFITHSVRAAVQQARADYTPVFLSQVPALFRSRQIAIDVALISVSPPDDYGFVSLGVSVDITKSAAESAKVVIAQVNRNMPRTYGDSFLHLSQINYLVEQDEALAEWPVPTQQDETIQLIAANVARLVPDGSTLQAGIGRLPDAVLHALTDKHDLGVHTEMFSDGVMKLTVNGNITCRKKTLHPGKIVGSFAAGSRALFDFIDNNPMFEMRPSEYTNDPLLVAREKRLVAINSGLEVDLTGQVCADSIGPQFYSGLGGHADFMRGAALAGGKPIIALPSTAVTKDGVRSRIASTLADGAGVITTRGDVHYVVTEYGVAYLHGKSMRERAMSLINIAHPDFRGELLHAAKRRRIVYPDQIMPPTRRPYPADYESVHALKDGSEVLLRPIRPDDEPKVRDMFYKFSEQTVYLRYHGQLKSMPHNKLQVFCNVDYDTEMALVGVVGTEEMAQIIGVGRYMTDPGKNSAELAFVVGDDWQRKGLGTHLFRRLIGIGRHEGIRRFTADVLAENSGMLKIFHRSGMNVETTTDEGVVHVVMSPVEEAALPRA
ncbi:MAG: GNAT family N-acetyltransferase [Planctomycetes bacterium]|nr:GNAT family N-acetyltransferase [Planctomycetota bacterium]